MINEYSSSNDCLIGKNFFALTYIRSGATLILQFKKVIIQIMGGFIKHWPLLAGLFFAGWIYESFLEGNFIGLHDTKLHALNFIGFYRHFYATNGSIAQWLPYGGLGQPALSSQCFITPIEYVVAVAGMIFRINKPILLWDISSFMEMMVFISGLYLCSLRLCRSNLIRLLAVFTGASTIVWQYQYDFCFLILAYIPLVIYSLLSYAETKSVVWIFCAWFFQIIGNIGAAAYLAPLSSALLFLIILTMNAAKGLPNKPCRKDIIISILLCSFSAALIGIYYISIMRSVEEITILVPGRDTVTNTVQIEAFLKYGGNIDDQDIFGVLTGENLLRHSLPYISPVAVALFACSVFVFFRSIFAKISIVFIMFVLAFSRGGMISISLYNWFPGMNYFRHIGLIHGYVVPVVILVGAWWLDAIYFKKEQDKKRKFFYLKSSCPY